MGLLGKLEDLKERARAKRDAEQATPGAGRPSGQPQAKGPGRPSGDAGTAATDTRDPDREIKPFSVTDTMTEMSRDEDAGTDAVLYDSVTDKLYRTANWGDVLDNPNNLFDIRTGSRQRLAGYVSQKTDDKTGTTTYDLDDSMNPFEAAVIVGIDEKIPEAGTEEFQGWVEKKFNEGIWNQALGSRITEENVDDFHTNFGQFASISAEDWIAMGRPDHIGNLKFDEYADKSDEEVLSQGLLLSADQKQRQHGLRKGLNKLGSNFGAEHLGTDLFKGMGYLSEVPLVGKWVAPLPKMQKTYEDARNAQMMGENINVWGEVGKTGASSAGSAALEGLRDALIVAAVVLAPTGIGTVLAGAAAGAVGGWASSLGTQALNTTIYGGYDSGALMRAGEKGAAAGAVEGAVSGLGAAYLPNAGVGPHSGLNSANAVQTAAGVGLRAGGDYFTNVNIYGAHKDEALDALALSLGSQAIGSAFGGKTDGAPMFTGRESFSARNPLFAQALEAGNPYAAFKEYAESESSLLGSVFGRGTLTQQLKDRYAGALRTASAFGIDPKSIPNPLSSGIMGYDSKRETLDNLSEWFGSLPQLGGSLDGLPAAWWKPGMRAPMVANRRDTNNIPLAGMPR